jgi:hypothetical protein
VGPIVSDSAFRSLLEQLALRLRSQQSKAIEIPRLDPADRVLVAALSRLPRREWRSFLVRPRTLLGWHQQLVRRRSTYQRRTNPGCPPIAGELRPLILGFAVEDPAWVIGGSRASWPGSVSWWRQTRSGRSCAGTASSERRDVRA